MRTNANHSIVGRTGEMTRTVTITQSMPSDEVACHETKFNNNLSVFQGDNARLTFSNTVFSDSARWNARAFLLRVESTEQ